MYSGRQGRTELLGRDNADEQFENHGCGRREASQLLFCGLKFRVTRAALRVDDAAMKKYSTQRVETLQSVSMRLLPAVPNGKLILIQELAY